MTEKQAAKQCQECLEDWGPNDSGWSFRQCPCEEYLEARSEPGVIEQIQTLLFGQHASAVCIGCSREGERVDGVEATICDVCYNRAPHERLLSEMEALGGA